jgi:tungstate transport system ATP-binding protein
MNPAYQIQNFSFGYNHQPTLSIQNLKIEAGQVTALVGPNGSGKTTFLLNLAFLEYPQQGNVLFFGSPAHQIDAVQLRRRVGLLLQTPYVFHDTVLGNITWGLKLRGISRRKSEELAREALMRVGLEGFSDRYARSLSGGESQRVALARALVLDPDVYLFDEPTNHLDHASAEKIREIIIDLNTGRHKTIIIATHDDETVKRLAHNVIHLCNGRISGNPPECGT